MKTNDIMKTFCLAALAIGVASCQNDEIESSSTTVATQDSQIRLSCTVAGGVESRAMVELNNEDTTGEYFQWNEGDSFTLYDIGSDGVTIPTNYTTFTISDYSDDVPSAYADFVGTGTLTEGNQVLAIYPAQGEISSSELRLQIDYEALMGNVYADYQEYMSNQMYMYATAQVDDADSGLEMEFNHLTCMARITYTNYTDEEQSIGSVDFRGDGKYIGQSMVYDFEEGAFSLDYASYFTQQYYADLTVAPDDSVDLYLLFFPGNEFADDGTITITIDGESVEMSTSEFSHTSFQAGYRYKFNVAKIEDELIWTKDYNFRIIYNQDVEYTTPSYEVRGRYYGYTEFSCAYISVPITNYNEHLYITLNADDRSYVDISYSTIISIEEWIGEFNFTITKAKVTKQGDGIYEVSGGKEGSVLVDSYGEYDCSIEGIVYEEGNSVFDISMDVLGGTHFIFHEQQRTVTVVDYY